METGRKAVALLSGGLDSTTALAIAVQQGFAVYALSFEYGQRAVIEIEAARHVAARSRVADHVVVRIDLGVFGGSALTGDLPMPRGRRADEIGHGIPPSYVPARNTIFLSFALAWAEVLGTGDIFIGAHILDFGGYPDCRPAYFRAYERMANLATRAGVEGSASFEIHTPLIDLSKAQIIRRGLELGVDYSLTVSCYTPSPDGEACGECDSCILRVKGFRENGLEDPVRYRKPRMTV